MKDYKKILEGVANIINTTKKSDIGFVNICTYISENCPELKESEDEQIRKELIQYFSTFTLETFAGLSPKKIIAWLEKQGEQKSVEHTWSEYDERMMNNLCRFLENYYGHIPLQGTISWLKSLRLRIGGIRVMNGTTVGKN